MVELENVVIEYKQGMIISFQYFYFILFYFCSFVHIFSCQKREDYYRDDAPMILFLERSNRVDWSGYHTHPYKKNYVCRILPLKLMISSRVDYRNHLFITPRHTLHSSIEMELKWILWTKNFAEIFAAILHRWQKIIFKWIMFVIEVVSIFSELCPETARMRGKCAKVFAEVYKEGSSRFKPRNDWTYACYWDWNS